MLRQFATNYLRSTLKFYACSTIVSRQPVKWLGFNGGSRRKSSATSYWKASTLIAVAQFAACEDNVKNKLHLPEPADLSNLNLIRRATVVTVDAATQLLTQTLAAAMESSEMYRNAMEHMMDHMDETLRHAVGSPCQDQLWDDMVSIRDELNSARDALLEIESFMVYAMRLATDAAEASYMAGAETISTAMCERLNYAEQMWNAERQKIKKLEDTYLKEHERFMVNYTKAAATDQRRSEEGVDV
ncbi:diablo homolog, mitochondrial-like isoform X1 [Schistocerca americana]|uniref:diablo homolog, mitochondrial-like isoform X1 n=1 Tax=Schistocerca americana TaxID=7009 RepID=UPI001F4FE26D|nr:diablo homolog, mitochondrial-like isoform X1 [Schistocerca americana]